jgi:hypothetical protein
VLPTAQAPTDGDLVSSNATKNKYSFSFFYTISNELGESAASQVTTIKAQRPWTTWIWKNPAGADTNDPNMCDDQLVVVMPLEVFTSAVDAGATKWTAYYWYQGPNDAPSVTAIRFAEIDLTSEPNHAADGWARLTPQQSKIGTGDPLIPSASTRYNASNPVKGSQGLVAMDRLILVGNPADPARISWSSAAPGDYHNFSTLLGGGTKQLTSGNLYITGCVKLWQNPQSVDTLTILNLSDDGRNNAYYMQPAQITSLSESIAVMGFGGGHLDAGHRLALRGRGGEQRAVPPAVPRAVQVDGQQLQHHHEVRVRHHPEQLAHAADPEPDRVRTSGQPDLLPGPQHLR